MEALHTGLALRLKRLRSWNCSNRMRRVSVKPQSNWLLVSAYIWKSTGRRKGAAARSKTQGLWLEHNLPDCVFNFTITHWNPVHQTPQTVILLITICQIIDTRPYVRSSIYGQIILLRAIVGQSSGGQHVSHAHTHTHTRADFIERISAWHSIIVRDGNLALQRLERQRIGLATRD